MASRIKQIEQNIDALQREYSKILEERTLVFLPRLAKRYPEHVVSFCSAMGSWSFYIDDNPVESGDSFYLGDKDETEDLSFLRPIEDLFDKARGDYGYNVIPVFNADMKHGEAVRVRYDW